MSITPATPNKTGRYYVNIPPYYYFMLYIEAWLKGRSLPEEAGSLLCSKLQERAPKREEMIAQLALMVGITPEALRAAILAGTIATDLSVIAEDQP